MPAGRTCWAWAVGCRSNCSSKATTLGALNLFSHTVDAFTSESEEIGLVFASHFAVAFASTRRLDNLALAVDTRDLIGQAKPVLVKRYGIDGERTFLVLLRIGQASHRKLIDLARELVASGRSKG